MATKLKVQAKTMVTPNTITNAKVQPQGRSNAQRQADYRVWHLKDLDGQLDRLSLLIHFRAKLALERLASCYGVTQRSMLERLLTQADRLAQQQAAAHCPDGQADYFDERISLPWQAVTR